MSRMKHLLRKLHIGGGGGGGGTSLNDPQRLPPDNRPDSHSHSPSPSSSASPAAATPFARSRTSESGAPPAQPRRAIAAAQPALAAAPAAAPAPAPAPAPSVDDQVDFNFFEEEFQVQLALAISVSDPDARGDPESAQIKAAKRISLGCAPSPNSTLVDFLSLRYWNYHFINYDEKVIDGFYDVHEVTSNPSLQGKLPSLADLQTMPVSDQVDYEVVLVNRALDHKLQQLESKALLIASECRATQLGPAVCGLVQKIAALVADSMGGPVGDADDMSKRWLLKSQELRKALNTIVLPLGCLNLGMARHRALLFKVLADRINLPCRLVKGSYCTGTDEGAVNIIKVDHESEYIVDLMGAPGTLIPAEMPSSQLQSSGFEIMSSNNIEETVKDLYLALDKKVNFQFVNNQGKVEGISCNTDLDQKLVGSGSGDSSQTYSQQEDVMGLIGKKQTAMSEDELMKPIPTLGGSGVSLLGMEEAASSAQEMKVKDVSKYVISAAQDPEFAQKLHAVLLESGASLPPGLFSDISSPQEVVEEMVKGDSCITEGMKIPGVEPVDFGNNQECAPDESVKNHGQDTDVSFSFWRPDCQKSIQNFSMGNPDSSAMGLRSPHSEQVQEQLIPCAPIAIQKPPANCFGVGALCLQESAGSITKYIEAKRNISSLAGQEKNNESIAKVIEATSTNLPDANSSSESSNRMPDDVAEWEIPWEDLQIGERIGLGLYGEVYRADWNGTEVAVKKFLDQDVSGDALEQFRFEIRIMLRLRHPNVVLFMGAVTRPPNLSILTEFLPRGSLYKLLHRPAVQLDEKRRLRMALDVAKGMNYLHTSHPTIVHRDLKTPNLLVDKNWVVKVCDFGLSRLKHHTFLSSKSAAGTPEWMAPEVLRNEPSNEKCDVYSFGVILWELATLRMPWSGMNPMQVVGAVGFQNRRLEIPSEVDPMVAQIIRDCWQSDPNLRPSFSQLLTPLKQLKHLVT